MPQTAENDLINILALKVATSMATIDIEYVTHTIREYCIMESWHNKVINFSCN